VLVVGRIGKTTRDSASHLQGQLQNLNADVLGVVVNSIGRGTRYGGYGYGYGYGYAAEYTARRSSDSGAAPGTNGHAPAEGRNGVHVDQNGAPAGDDLIDPVSSRD
jgi:Mrp family chromosome partitioning ATPase